MRELHTLDSSIHNECETIVYQNKKIEVLKKHHCDTSVAHLNTQRLQSSFGKFSYMMNKYNFDTVALSETWLKNNKTQLEYVQIDGYTSKFKNRESKLGGRVVFYIKEHMSFNNQHDLEKTGESIEILWIEVQDRNKSTLVLIGAVYQPSSNETKKRVWLEKFVQILTEIYIKWSEIIIIAGDFNIDLLKRNKQSQRSQRSCKDILHLFFITSTYRKSNKEVKNIDRSCH